MLISESETTVKVTWRPVIASVSVSKAFELKKRSHLSELKDRLARRFMISSDYEERGEGERVAN